jgi:uncharacterized membrane protein
MKFTTEIIISKPLEIVLRLFDNVENMKKWQPDLESYELLDGTPGEPGARMKLVYNTGKRRIEMIETITVKNLPEEFSGYYELKGIKNLIKNSFHDLGDGSTKWKSECEFILSGFMKIIGWIMPGAFKKQSLLMMDRFKSFAENS